MGQRVEIKRVAHTGIRMFRENWFYKHDLMKNFIGQMVTVYYDESDFGKIDVEMPDGEKVVAKLKSVTSRNSKTLETSCDHLGEVIEIYRHALDQIAEMDFFTLDNSASQVAQDAIRRSDTIFMMHNEEISNKNGGEK